MFIPSCKAEPGFKTHGWIFLTGESQACGNQTEIAAHKGLKCTAKAQTHQGILEWAGLEGTWREAGLENFAQSSHI